MSDDGVGFPNLVCYNDHGNAGQIMESRRFGGYECKECGRIAESVVTWEDPDE